MEGAVIDASLLERVALDPNSTSSYSHLSFRGLYVALDTAPRVLLVMKCAPPCAPPGPGVSRALGVLVQHLSPLAGPGILPARA